MAASAAKAPDSDSPQAEEGLTPFGKILTWLFLLGVSTMAVGNCRWVKDLDMPEPDVFPANSGRFFELTGATATRSIQGLYRALDVQATLFVDDRARGRALEVEDIGGSDWGDTIEIKENWIKHAVTKGLALVKPKTKVKVPDDPDLVGRTVRIRYEMELETPQPVEGRKGKQGYRGVVGDEEFDVRLRIMPRGHKRLYRHITGGAGLVTGLVVVIALIRCFLPSNKRPERAA